MSEYIKEEAKYIIVPVILATLGRWKKEEMQRAKENIDNPYMK